MLDGHIVQVGTPRDVYERPSSEAVASFLGLRNLRDGIVSKGVLRLPPFGDLPCGGPDGRVRVVIRPETLLIHSASSRVGVPARIARVLDAGERVRYEAEIILSPGTRPRSPLPLVGGHDATDSWLEIVALGPPAWGTGERVRIELAETPWLLAMPVGRDIAATLTPNP
jgi:ABC-type sugar transport system ATPase subunit